MDELKNLILEAFPGFMIDSAYDYGDIVVFNMLPKDYVKSTIGDDIMNNSFAINKKTKEIKTFFPFDIPLEQYKAGKKVM